MECREIHGFNYDGSWGTSALDLWQHHDNGTMAVEIARGKHYFPRWNVCRWWLSQEAFQRDPERFLANFESGLAIFHLNDIAVVPLLFNRWRDPVCDFGGVSLEHIVPGLSFGEVVEDLFAHGGKDWPRPPALIERLHLEYLEAVVGHHREDPRIFAWDLCNEPLMARYVDDAASDIRKAELQWLTWLYRSCKRIGAAQPLTIGNYSGKTAVALTEPISDIISFHPYYIWNAPGADESKYEAYLDETVAFAETTGKELFASETVWGADDDDKHLKIMGYTLGELRKRRIGFTVHALQHSLVADLHFAAYGPVGHSGVLHFVNPDGSLRKGHEQFNDFC